MKKALVVTGILAGVILTAVTVTNIIKNRQADFKILFSECWKGISRYFMSFGLLANSSINSSVITSG